MKKSHCFKKYTPPHHPPLWMAGPLVSSRVASGRFHFPLFVSSWRLAASNFLHVSKFVSCNIFHSYFLYASTVEMIETLSTMSSVYNFLHLASWLQRRRQPPTCLMFLLVSFQVNHGQSESGHCPQVVFTLLLPYSFANYSLLLLKK